MLPCTAALFSSAVPVLRLLEANFGTLELRSANENRPPRSNTRKPSLAPFWTVAFGASMEASDQLPTSWLFLIFDFGALPAVLADNASPNAVMTVILIMPRRFIVCLHGWATTEFAGCGL